MVTLAANWWSFVLRGVLAVLFGLIAWLMPHIALGALILLFGAYAIVDGIFNIVAAFRRTGDDRAPWWALLVSGIVSLIAGFVAFFYPGLTALALVFVIAGWAIATGVMSIVAAVRLRRQIEGEWLLALSGALSVVFGVLAAIFPGAGALAILIWIGAYAIVFGITLIVLGLRLRSWLRRTGDHLGHGFHAVVTGH